MIDGELLYVYDIWLRIFDIMPVFPDVFDTNDIIASRKNPESGLSTNVL